MAARRADAGDRRCLLVSDTGQRHNPLPSEALRIFAQTVFEKGVSEEDVDTMIRRNPRDLLDLDSAPALPDDVAATWAAAMAVPPGHAHADGEVRRTVHRADGDADRRGTGPRGRDPMPVE